MDRNQVAFPTYAHRMIWSKGLLLAPPEESLVNFPEDEKKSQLDLHYFLSNAYEDMYQYPEKYGIDCVGIEEAMGQKEWHKARNVALHHHQKERMKKLEEIKRTEFLQNFLKNIAPKLEWDGSQFFEQAASFRSYLRGLKFRYGFSSSDDTLEKVLERNGVCIQYAGGRAFFSNRTYPEMFHGLYQWGQRIESSKKNAEKNRYKVGFHYLDCRVFSPDYKVTLENSMWFMSDELSNFMRQIQLFFNELGLSLAKPDHSLYFSLGCKYKGLVLACLKWEESVPVFQVGMFTASLPKTDKQPSPQYTEFEKRVEEMPHGEQLKKLCFQHMTRCKKCGCCEKYFHVPPSRCGRPSWVFGKEIRLCGGRWKFEIHSFSPQNLETVKTLIQLNYDICKEKKK